LCFVGDRVADVADENTRQRAAVVRAEHDQVGTVLLGSLQDRAGGIAESDDRPGVRDAEGRELRYGALQLGVVTLRRVGWVGRSEALLPCTTGATLVTTTVAFVSLAISAARSSTFEASGRSS
jgi:hypothetical protein